MKPSCPRRKERNGAVLFVQPTLLVRVPFRASCIPEDTELQTVWQNHRIGEAAHFWAFIGLFGKGLPIRRSYGAHDAATALDFFNSASCLYVSLDASPVVSVFSVRRRCSPDAHLLTLKGSHLAHLARPPRSQIRSQRHH